MENLTAIISIACTAAGFLATAITFIARFVKSAKEKKAAQDIIKLCDAIMPFIRKAESFLNYTGLEKKEYVLTKANQFAIENKIRFNAALVGDKIEELVRLTREVNFRESVSANSTNLKNKFTLGVKAL